MKTKQLNIFTNSISELKDFLLIVKSELVRDYIFMKRYPLEPLSFLFFMYLILLAIYAGFNQLAPGTAALNKEKMIIGYCLMQFVLATQMGWSGQIQYESQTGTLEQLSISGHNLAGILLARGIAQIPRQIVNFSLLITGYTFVMQGTQVSPYFILQTIPLLMILAPGVYGVSFLFAGLTLLFKRIGFFFQIINFAFLGLFWQDRAILGDGLAGILYDIFPFTQGMRLISASMTGKETDTGYFISFVISSIISTVAGYYIFLLMEKRARKQGLLSQY